jgi:hypothetical protein
MIASAPGISLAQLAAFLIFDEIFAQETNKEADS